MTVAVYQARWCCCPPPPPTNPHPRRSRAGDCVLLHFLLKAINRIAHFNAMVGLRLHSAVRLQQQEATVTLPCDNRKHLQLHPQDSPRHPASQPPILLYACYMQPICRNCTQQNLQAQSAACAECSMNTAIWVAGLSWGVVVQPVGAFA
jgi:hypothetical protein